MECYTTQIMGEPTLDTLDIFPCEYDEFIKCQNWQRKTLKFAQIPLQKLKRQSLYEVNKYNLESKTG